MKKKICFRCHKEIKEGSNYYAFTEWKDKKEVRTDYAHKECWDNFLKRVGDTTEAMGVVRGLKKHFVDMGVLKQEEEYVI